MDTKRLILAIVLSIVVITVYQYVFVPKPVKPIAQPASSSSQPLAETYPDKGQVPGQVADETGSGETESSRIEDIFSQKKEEKKIEQKVEAAPVDQDLKDTGIKEITVENELFEAVFTNQGGALKSFILKKRFIGDKSYLDDLGNPLNLVSDSVKKYGLYPFHFSPFEDNEVFSDLNKQLFLYQGDLRLNASQDKMQEIVFRFADKSRNLEVIKRFVFSPYSYVIDLEFDIIRDGKHLEAPVVFGPDIENNVNPERVMQQNLKIGAYDGRNIQSVEFGKLKTEKTKSGSLEKSSGPINGSFFWAAYERTYFAAIFRTDPRNSNLKYFLVKEGLEKGKYQLYSYLILSNPTALYLGPKDEEVLSTVSGIFPDVNKVIEYGWFGSIAKIMLKGINFIHVRVLNFGNYGWAIILFTIFLKLILFPLTYSSSVSMAKMQTLQPKIKAIRKKYKNQKDPTQRRNMNTEMMALYKQEKVNPAGGCLPLLLQLPILWGFFRLLAVSINVRHEPWLLWIKDLSLKDPYYILPILMGITQIILQKMSPSGGVDGAQKKMMYIMPVVIVFFVMNLPSGLTLYWFVSNILQMGQQHLINKKIYAKKRDEEKQWRAEKRKKGGKVK
jgi:YidC/Oxa1 family membrane protein insertase